MTTYLEALDTGVNIPLERGRALVIGRSEDCNVRIASAMISRRHCMIVESEDGVSVRDMGSRNGTLCNGRAIQHAVLHPGDTITLANVRFVVRSDDADSASGPDTPTTRHLE